MPAPAKAPLMYPASLPLVYSTLRVAGSNSASRPCGFLSPNYTPACEGVPKRLDKSPNKHDHVSNSNDWGIRRLPVHNLGIRSRVAVHNLDAARAPSLRRARQ